MSSAFKEEEKLLPSLLKYSVYWIIFNHFFKNNALFHFSLHILHAKPSTNV